MRIWKRPSVLLAAVLLTACSQPAAQSNDPAELRKEIESLKRDIAEIRDYLRQATGGRFGGPRLEDATIDLTGAPVKGAAGE